MGSLSDDRSPKACTPRPHGWLHALIIAPTAIVFVGAGDRFIADRFFRHFLLLGLEGGVIGGGVAMLLFGFSESIAGWFSGTPVGDQFGALLGTFSLRASGYLVLAMQAVMIAAITAWASRRTLFATLDDIE